MQRFLLDMQSILFICVGNACRSQMAEGFARAYGPQDLVVYSAGSHPAGFVAREAIEGMREKGIDISRHYSKGISDLPKIKFDYVVTMGCGDVCPTLPMEGDRWGPSGESGVSPDSSEPSGFASGERIDWQIPDPIGGSIEFFRSVRDDIEEKVRNLLQKLFA